MIKIREVMIEDTVKLIELLIKLIHEKPPIALELESLVMKGARWVEPFLNQKVGFFIVAEDDDKIIGFCYLATPKLVNPVAHIAIAVDKDYRRKNTGSQMFNHVAKWAFNTHLKYIIADVWNWNPKSLNFFKKLSFGEKLRFRDKFKGIPEEKVRMVLEL
jgi:RimJ/RimL family protein N-acetyltransferase